MGCDHDSRNRCDEARLPAALARIAVLECEIAELRLERDLARGALGELRAENARLRAVCEDFCATVQAALASYEPHRGMHVPYHGDFCAKPHPSVIAALRQWAATFRAALGEAGKDGSNVK